MYVHVNKTNGKKYVGITSKANPNHRWQGGRGYKENTYFYSAIEKYGWDSFEHIILYEGLDERQAKDMEIKLIAEWRTNDRLYGYNMTTGGDGTPGCIPSEDTRHKLSVARRKENLSEETLARRSAGLKGRKFSQEHRRKIGKANSKPVVCTDNDGVTTVYESAHSAEIQTGISHSHISQCCHGTRQTAGKLHWRFLESNT